MVGIAFERALERCPLPGVISLYLFGSRNEGREHRQSDLDVGVLLDRSEHPTRRDRFEERLRLIARLSGLLPGITVDLVVLNDAPPELARHVVTRGRRVYCADASKDHGFVRDAQLRAADIAPFLRRARRTKLEALVR